MLDFRIYSFLAACEHLSFTRAAQELNLTQPAVTQHIQYLEKQYQVKFFVRENNQLSLTTEGMLFRNAMLAINQAEQKIRDGLLNSGIDKPIIRFGATKNIAEYELPDRLAAYLNAYPDRRIQLSVEDTPALLRQLDEGFLHFAIVDNFFPRNKYQYILWSSEEYVYVCSGNQPDPDLPVHLKDLLPLTLIIYTINLEGYDIFLHLLDSRAVAPSDFNRIIEINDLTAIKKLVIAGCGITFLPRRAVAAELASHLLKELPIVDGNMSQEFYFIWPKDSTDGFLYQFMYDKLHDLDFSAAVPLKKDC